MGRLGGGRRSAPGGAPPPTRRWESAYEWNRALERYDVMVNLVPDSGDVRLEFALANPVRRCDPRWISVRAILGEEKVENLTAVTQEVMNRIGGDVGQTMALFGKVHARMQRLWQIRERDIPIIKISHEVEDVAEIFARLNQAGTRVKEADVILALAAVRNPGWVREEYLPFYRELEEHNCTTRGGTWPRRREDCPKRLPRRTVCATSLRPGAGD